MESNHSNHSSPDKLEMAPASTPVSFDDFIAFHGIQLYAVKFPRDLERKLYDKLTNVAFDIGNKVKIMVNEEEERIELVCHGEKIKTNEDVYLIDHAWTFKYRDAEKTLRENEVLLDRLL